MFDLDITDPTNADVKIIYLNRLPSVKNELNLLRVSNDDGDEHYVLIKNLNGLFRGAFHEIHCCEKCAEKFSSDEAFQKHIAMNRCNEFKSEAMKSLPKDEECEVRFKISQSNCLTLNLCYCL